MQQVTQLSVNTFNITEKDTLPREMKVLVGHNGHLKYECYYGTLFMGDIFAVKEFIIRKSIEGGK